MAVKYSLAKMNTKLNGKSYEKVYAHAQVNETTSLKKFSQLIASQTTVSRADVSAVLISSVENLVMELQRGNQVEFGELGKFRLQLMSDGTDTASDFTSDNIKGVRIQFVPGDDLADMFNQMEFTPVASRLVQKAALKAEKTGAATVDIAEAKAAASKKNNAAAGEGGKDNTGSGSQTGGSQTGSGSQAGGGSQTGSGSQTGGSSSDTGDGNVKEY